MTITWTEILAAINLVMLIGMPVGAYVAIRSSMASTGQVIQERVREALHDENELLQSQVKRLEAQCKRLDRLMDLAIDMLEKTRNIKLEIDKENYIVALRDASGLMQVSKLPEEEK